MAVRAVRGATRLAADDVVDMTEAVRELLLEMLTQNDLTTDHVISVLFTSTPDLVCGFPAAAARKIGFAEVPLICAQEIDVPDALPRVVRIMAHVETDQPRSGVKHVFLRGAQVLREDLHK